MKQILPPMPLQDEILVTADEIKCNTGTITQYKCQVGIDPTKG